MRRLFAIPLLLCALGCKPKPPEGFPVYEKFAEHLAKGDVPGARTFVIESAAFEAVEGGMDQPPEHGSIKHTPLYDAGVVGPVAWVRHVIESQTREADGSVRVSVKTDVCRTDPRQGTGVPCAIPDRFRHRVLLEKDGDTWKVGGLTEEILMLRR